MTSDDAERSARAALERLLGAAAVQCATLEPLAGGINRRSYRVAVGADQWVLRLPTPGAEGLIDVATEAEVMRAAAAAGLAPAVAAVDAEHGLLLTKYRSGARAWTAAAARAPRNVVRAAGLLRALHAVEVNAPAYAAERIARKYLDALSAGVGAQRSRFDVRARKWADELLGLARHYDSAYLPSALCHNDLVAANVLDDGDLVLVDFEYAVRAAPALDLAGLAGMNDYGENECRELLAAYYAGGPPRVSLTELGKIVRMVRLVAFFWARLGELRVAAAEPYAVLAAALDERLS